MSNFTLPVDNNHATVQALKPQSTVTVSIGASSVASSGLTAGVYRLYATSDCHIEVAQTATATTSDMPLAAKQPEYFTIHANDQVAAIQASASGTLFITRMA